MAPCQIEFYEHRADLPELKSHNFFHSPQMMQLCESTPRHTPLMAVATDAQGCIKAHLLVVVRYHHYWKMPFAWISGEGEYADDVQRQELFGEMMCAVRERLSRRVLYIEVANLSRKMFGYKALRQADFFPVKWMSVHNSLHSLSPSKRISPRMMAHIEHAEKRGAVSKEVETEEEFKAFYRLLRHHYLSKPRHYIPHPQFLHDLMASGHGRIFITRFHQLVIGGVVCIYSGTDAYVWYTAARRKSFAPLHPYSMTIWKAMTDAYENKYAHIRFMDVGMPFRRNAFRDFILRFGGKETSSYRWFFISIGWVNRLASRLFRF